MTPNVQLHYFILSYRESYDEITDIQVLNPSMREDHESKKIILNVLVEINHSRILNIRNHNIYTHHFVLNVLDLSKDNLATKRDRENHLDIWSKLLKGKTWEEIRALAAQDPVYRETKYDAP